MLGSGSTTFTHLLLVQEDHNGEGAGETLPM